MSQIRFFCLTMPHASSAWLDAERQALERVLSALRVALNERRVVRLSRA